MGKKTPVEGQAEDNEFGEISGPFIHYKNGDLVVLIGSGLPGSSAILASEMVTRRQLF
jgi:hypothetical protein